MTLLKTDCSLKEAEEESNHPQAHRIRVMLISERCALTEKANEIGLLSRTEEMLTRYCHSVSRVAVVYMADQEEKRYITGISLLCIASNKGLL